MRKLIVTRRTLFRISEEFQHVVSSDVLLKPTALRVFGVISVPQLYVVTLDILLKHRGKKRFFMFYTYNVTMNVFLLLSFVLVLEKLISDNSSMPALYIGVSFMNISIHHSSNPARCWVIVYIP